MALASKEKALAEKELGNAAYKGKNFKTALDHYNNAIKHEPGNMTFLNNKAAVYFEQGDYAACIKECEQAVIVGRESLSPYKLISKAFERAAKAAVKSGDLKQAVELINNSLTEKRDPAKVKWANELKNQLEEKKRLEYINPELSEEEKGKGNALFAQGDYSTAIKHYTEAIKRNPSNLKIYSNRAACYTKVGSFLWAIKDCDKAIELDSTWVKAYLRKGACLMGLKEFSKALDCYKKAYKLDPNCKEAMEQWQICTSKVNSEDPETRTQAGMNDPEVCRILSDPSMRAIIEQSVNDPKALEQHMQNPKIFEDIMTLRSKGIIRMS